MFKKIFLFLMLLVNTLEMESQMLSVKKGNDIYQDYMWQADDGSTVYMRLARKQLAVKVGCRAPRK